MGRFDLSRVNVAGNRLNYTTSNDCWFIYTQARVLADGVHYEGEVWECSGMNKRRSHFHIAEDGTITLGVVSFQELPQYIQEIGRQMAILIVKMQEYKTTSSEHSSGKNKINELRELSDKAMKAGRIRAAIRLYNQAWDLERGK